MRPLFLVLVALFGMATNAQQLLLTEADHRPGERSLSINGFFRDADTVLVQIYHDGKELHLESRIYTWAYALGEFEHYVLKFTDEQKRVKRIYILELSDNQLEFIPPIEVDFSVAGNLALIKQRDGKLDFLQFDVGMSRKQP